MKNKNIYIFRIFLDVLMNYIQKCSSSTKVGYEKNNLSLVQMTQYQPNRCRSLGMKIEFLSCVLNYSGQDMTCHLETPVSVFFVPYLTSGNCGTEEN